MNNKLNIIIIITGIPIPTATPIAIFLSFAVIPELLDFGVAVIVWNKVTVLALFITVVEARTIYEPWFEEYFEVEEIVGDDVEKEEKLEEVEDGNKNDDDEWEDDEDEDDEKIVDEGIEDEKLDDDVKNNEDEDEEINEDEDEKINTDDDDEDEENINTDDDEDEKNNDEDVDKADDDVNKDEVVTDGINIWDDDDDNDDGDDDDDDKDDELEKDEEDRVEESSVNVEPKLGDNVVEDDNKEEDDDNVDEEEENVEDDDDNDDEEVEDDDDIEVEVSVLKRLAVSVSEDNVELVVCWFAGEKVTEVVEELKSSARFSNLKRGIIALFEPFIILRIIISAWEVKSLTLSLLLISISLIFSSSSLVSFENKVLNKLSVKLKDSVGISSVELWLLLLLLLYESLKIVLFTNLLLLLLLEKVEFK